MTASESGTAADTGPTKAAAIPRGAQDSGEPGRRPAPDVGSSADEDEAPAVDEVDLHALPHDTPFLQEDLPPDFWDEPVAFDELPTARAAPPAARARSPERASVPASGRRQFEPATGAEEDGAEEALEEDTFAALRQLFPGRILAVEPIESADDAPTGDDPGGGVDPTELDGAVELEPDDADTAVAEVD